MESITNNFENFADEQVNFIMKADYFPGPGDENDGEEENENDDNQSSEASEGDANPPLDEGVVHSPLTTQPGKPIS